MKTLNYPVSKEDFIALEIGERVKITHFAFKDNEFELCDKNNTPSYCTVDVSISADHNGTMLRMVREI